MKYLVPVFTLIAGLIIGYFLFNTSCPVIEEPGLTTRERLFNLSNEKTEDLPLSWSHTSSNGEGLTQRVAKNGLVKVGENLYRGNCDLRTAVKLWEESPDHNKVLDKGFKNLVITGTEIDSECYISYEAEI